LISGTYSSIFIAAPILASLREREPAIKALNQRVAAKQGGVATSDTPRAKRKKRRK
jgi:preprotein translocase subunit SecF